MASWRRSGSRRVSSEERAEEMRAHLELYAEQLLARGWSADDALREARLRFGNPRVKLEEVDALSPFTWIEGVGRDLSHALRRLRGSPAFALVVLVVLTAGIGASTAIYSVVDAVVLRGLPFDGSDRLVAVSSVNLRDGSLQPAGFAAPDATDLRRLQDVFDPLAAIAEGPMQFTWTSDRSERVYGTRSTADLFAVLRVRPALGRLFSAENEIQGRHRVVLISHGFWQRRFGADPNVIGRTIVVDKTTREILGVMPPGFTYPIGVPERVDFWVPWVQRANEQSRNGGRASYISLVGRLKAGVSLEQARARMAQINGSLALEYPDWFKNQGIDVRPLVDAIVGDRVHSWMLMLLGSVVCVLLIACVNVANLFLVRALTRSHEIRVRAALGASRWRLAQGLLAESLLVSILGTALAFVFGFWAVDVLRAAMPVSVPRLSSVAINLRVLGIAGIGASVCALLMSAAPALYLSRPNVAAAFRVGRGYTSPAQRLRTIFIILEVALAVVLLVGSGLFISSFVRVVRTDLGFDHRRVLTFNLYPHGGLGPEEDMDETSARANAMVTGALERIRQMPGVESAAAIAGGLPLTQSWTRYSVEVAGQRFIEDEMVDVRQATPDYVKVMRLRLLEGRWLGPADTREAERVVVLNDEAARRYFGARTPIGAEIGIQGKQPWKVIGVVAGLRLGGPESSVRPEAYFSTYQSPIVGAAIVVRTAGDPLALVPAVTTAVTTIEPTPSMSDVTTLDAFFADLVAARRFNMLLLSVFGILAIVIAALGIYGVMAYLVTHRTQEIGVRMALGADAARVLRSVLWEACRYLVVGVALGLAGAALLATLVEGFLFRVPPRDPGVYSTAAVLILFVGLAAAWLPARRAAHVDPLIALRID